MQFELRPAMQRTYIGDEPVSVPTSQADDFFVYVGDQCYGYLYASKHGYVLGLHLPDQDVEYSAMLTSKEMAMSQIERVIPILVGNPHPPRDPNSDEAAAAALRFALEIDADEGESEPMEFLRIWSQTDRSEILRKWPNAPEEVFGT